jgi:hypothetical protein
MGRKEESSVHHHVLASRLLLARFPRRYQSHVLSPRLAPQTATYASVLLDTDLLSRET